MPPVVGPAASCLGLGGSCTNDCGIGMAAPWASAFWTGPGRRWSPWRKPGTDRGNPSTGGKPAPAHPGRPCDVTNPLLGSRGATYTFGPQKGADGPALEALEEGMTSFARVLARYAGVEERPDPRRRGGGRSGGRRDLPPGRNLDPRAELLLDQAGFDGLLEGADLVITGEGRMDGQSAAGKVPGAVAARCRRAGVPCLPCAGPWGMEPRFSTARGSPPSSAPSGGGGLCRHSEAGGEGPGISHPKPPSACS